MKSKTSLKTIQIGAAAEAESDSQPVFQEDLNHKFNKSSQDTTERG